MTQRADPVVAVEAQREIERLIGRLVVQNTTLTAQLGRLSDQLAAVRGLISQSAKRLVLTARSSLATLPSWITAEWRAKRPVAALVQVSSELTVSVMVVNSMKTTVSPSGTKNKVSNSAGIPAEAPAPKSFSNMIVLSERRIFQQRRPCTI